MFERLRLKVAGSPTIVATLIAVAACAVAFLLLYVWVMNYGFVLPNVEETAQQVSGLVVYYTISNGTVISLGLQAVRAPLRIFKILLWTSDGAVCKYVPSSPIEVPAHAVLDIRISRQEVQCPTSSVNVTIVKIMFTTHAGQITYKLGRPLLLTAPWFRGKVFRYRLPIYVYSMLPETLYNVTIRIVLTSNNFTYWDYLGNLTFTYGPSQEVPYWIQQLDLDRKILVAWIKVPELRPGENLVYMYFSPDGTPNYGTWRNIMTRVPSEYVYYIEIETHEDFVRAGSAMNWHEDDACWQLLLPFSFSFYNTRFNTVYVCSNGLISNDIYTEWESTEDKFKTHLMVSPFWADLRTDCPGCDIYVKEDYQDKDGKGVYIRWVTAFYYWPVGYNGQQEFAAILYESGLIKFMYNYITGASSTDDTPVIGVSLGDGIHYTRSKYTGDTDWQDFTSLVLYYVPVKWPREYIRLEIGQVETS